MPESLLNELIRLAAEFGIDTSVIAKIPQGHC
jgi:hypothetical protein